MNIGGSATHEFQFSDFIYFWKTKTVADKGSCFGWAKYQGRNFGTAESIVGFSSAVKYGLKHGPKVGQNRSRRGHENAES
jgi:hypothetical protein